MTGRKIYTEWFRSPAMWPLLTEHLQTLQRPVTVWSAACGTGQEAYSAAIMLAQHNIPGRVIATDIDRPNLDIARTGVYPRHETRFRLTTRQVDRYFVVSDGGSLQVGQEIRALVTFDELCLGRDAAPRCDVALLCNVWRHLSRQEQGQVADQVRRALNPGGRLVVGSADLLEPDDGGQLREVQPRGLGDHFVETRHYLIWRPRPH